MVVLDVEGISPASDGAMFIDAASVVLLQVLASFLIAPNQAHDSGSIAELDPSLIAEVPIDFVGWVEGGDLFWRLARVAHDAFDVVVGEKDDGLAATLTTAGAAEVEQVFPVVGQIRFPYDDCCVTALCRLGFCGRGGEPPTFARRATAWGPDEHRSTFAEATADRWTRMVGESWRLRPELGSGP